MRISDWSADVCSSGPGGEPRWLPGVANFGRRPTVAGEDLRLEVHLFDFTDDIYGETLRVRLIDFIRAEKKFDGLDALQAQIALDCGEARAILAEDRFSWPASLAPAPLNPNPEERRVG